MDAIELKGVTVKYKIGHKVINAIEDISLNVKYGECFCIIGRNGSGKSTLLKAILGLVPVSCGSINLGVSKNEISYLPQITTIDPNFPATVGEIILSGAQKSQKTLPFYRRQNYLDVDSTLDIVGIQELKSRKFGELSGGQQQRVLLARALIRSPKILFLDEPCSGLDESISQHFYDLLENLNKEHRVTIVMISHDSLQMEKCATSVLYLAKRALFYGTIKEWLITTKRISCIH
jgi:zinc transport system ATP-binding protein